MGTAKDYSLTAPSQQHCLQPVDRILTVKLEVEKRLASFSYDAKVYALRGESGEQLLRELIETGRCHWVFPKLSPLTLGPTKTVELHWQMDDKGSQTLQVLGEGYSVFSLDHLWYLDQDKAVLGLLETGLDKRANRVMISAPKIPAEQTQAVVKALKQHKKLSALHLPTVFNQIKTENVIF